MALFRTHGPDKQKPKSILGTTFDVVKISNIIMDTTISAVIWQESEFLHSAGPDVTTICSANLRVISAPVADRSSLPPKIGD
jgi:hypothetical protein